MTTETILCITRGRQTGESLRFIESVKESVLSDGICVLVPPIKDIDDFIASMSRSGVSVTAKHTHRKDNLSPVFGYDGGIVGWNDPNPVITGTIVKLANR